MYLIIYDKNNNILWLMFPHKSTPIWFFLQYFTSKFTLNWKFQANINTSQYFVLENHKENLFTKE